ncbi:hypothetical protein RFI_02037 [Reticulomyxa filosa]|uniref:Uncharacterized protein n=1 Tax=Reticulomyxa filosa TaxID=46433 RepID=X6PBI2_RETFI|nr:hypothetical protein RFI_02037 [Reticulomyxa filosa]|eukprot:ETO35037.1 hypothetical protein RFI_02037 [Reticulomyxa filosa]
MILYWIFKVEPFDYKLSHIARECPRKRKVCKCCGLANHERQNTDTRMIQANTNVFYAKNSIQVIHSREKLGIKLTRKEDALLKKKTYQHIPIKSNVQRQPKNYSYTDAAKDQMEIKARMDLRSQRRGPVERRVKEIIIMNMRAKKKYIPFIDFSRNSVSPLQIFRKDFKNFAFYW